MTREGCDWMDSEGCENDRCLYFMLLMLLSSVAQLLVDVKTSYVMVPWECPDSRVGIAAADAKSGIQ